MGPTYHRLPQLLVLRPPPSPLLLLYLLLLPAPFSGTVLPRYFIPSHPLTPSFSFIFSLRRLVPALSHHRVCSLSLFLFFFYPFSSRFVSFYPFCLSSTITPHPLLLPSFLSFRCCFCSLFSGCLAPSLSTCLPLSFAFTSLLSSSRALTTCVLLAIQSTRKGSWVRVGDVLIRRF